jgi:sporulation protein YlmC with PRC-barrel domain
MKHKVRDLRGYTLGASDGEIGKVKEAYFEDDTWKVRYLVVETGRWLSGRTVLIPPAALIKGDWHNKSIAVNLTKEQIKNSPDIDTEKPVNRQQEIELYGHFGWPYYWGRGLWAGGIGTTGMMMQDTMPLEEAIQEVSSTEGGDSKKNAHLRSTNNVDGYNIRAIDGEIGDVYDFIFDDNTWKIDFIIVDTGKWLPGKKVLISPKWIRRIDWVTSSVVINVAVEKVKNSPVFDPHQPLTETYETSLHDHYDKSISH